MRILIVGRTFFPRVAPRAFRTTELARELANQGHSVTVAIPVEDLRTRTFCKTENLELVDLGAPSWPEVSIRGNGITRLVRRGIRRAGSLFLEYPEVEIAFRIKRALKGFSDYDLAISIAAPHAVHWGFCSLLRKNAELCKIWIADCGDPYMGLTIDTFGKMFYFKHLEKQFCRRADFITVPVEGAIPAYYPEFRDKIRVIPQGFRFPPKEFWPRYEPNSIPTFAFAGNFIPGVRDPRPLLKYLSESLIPFKFICFTKQLELFHEYQSLLGDRIECRPFIPRDELLCELAKMDFLLNLENRTERQSPSKLIDYALTGRPILTMDAFAPDYEKLERFFKRDYSGQLQLDNLHSYDITNVAHQFTSLAAQSL